jgi:hypothetical protein
MGKRTIERKKVGVCYIYFARVRGNGPFPYDMLRYDACFPAQQEDVLAMCQRERAGIPGLQRTVNLMTVTTARIKTPFHPARWATFGWECEPR